MFLPRNVPPDVNNATLRAMVIRDSERPTAPQAPAPDLLASLALAALPTHRPIAMPVVAAEEVREVDEAWSELKDE
jgi:hypothetical protein